MRGPPVLTGGTEERCGCDGECREAGRRCFRGWEGCSTARQNRATVVRETGTSAARRISVMAWYDAPLRRSSAIPDLSVRSFCHFRGTVGA